MTDATARRAVPVSQVHLQGGLWGARQAVNRLVSLPVEYERCKETGRSAVFDLNWHAGMSYRPHPFYDSDVAKWIERHGESINIVGFNVDSTAEAVEELKGKGYSIIKFGEYGELIPFRDCQCSFVHPKQTNGILVELIDYKWEELKK